MKRCGLVLVAVGVCAAACGADDAAVQRDLAKMQGEWVIASGERGGTGIPEEEAKPLRRIVEGDHYTLARDGEVIGRGTFTIDPTKNPKTIDVRRERAKNKPLLGIYELDGDTFKICVAAEGDERPNRFTSEPGSHRTLVVWKRAGR
jgi:uncharacterized protein (TIGR03067 family)